MMKIMFIATKLIAITNLYFNSNAINLATLHSIEIVDRSNILSYKLLIKKHLKLLI